MNHRENEARQQPTDKKTEGEPSSIGHFAQVTVQHPPKHGFFDYWGQNASDDHYLHPGPPIATSKVIDYGMRGLVDGTEIVFRMSAERSAASGHHRRCDNYGDS